MFYEDNYHANNNDNNDLNEKSKSHNKHKLLNPNFLTYKKAFNQKWKDGKYYKNINIDCYKSGTQGSIIYNAVTGYNTSHYVGSKDEHIYYNVTDCSGKFSKDRISLQYLMGEVKSVNLAKLPKAKGPGVAWTVDSGLKVLNEEPLSDRNYGNGQKMFSAGLCVACHRFGNEGGGVGPDLTNLAKRSDYKSILESTIHPNMVVSEQFEQHELKMKDGSITMGRIVTEEKGEYGLVQSGLQPLNLTNIKKSKVASKKGSKISMMPGGLINSMNAEELKDLIAYFISAGDRKHKVFRSLKKLKIELISALYGEDGNPKRQMDIKSKIQKELDRMQYDFSVTNKLAGKDPAGGVVKTLNLKYKLNGKTYSKKIRENGVVSF